MNLPEHRPHTDAVIVALEDVGLTVGDADAPAGDHDKYAVVHPRGDVRIDGSVDAPYDDADLVFQVTCVGTTREQAEWVLDKVRGALLGQTVTVDGRSLRCRPYIGGRVEREDDTAQPPMFSAFPWFALTTTPA